MENITLPKSKRELDLEKANAAKETPKIKSSYEIAIESLEAMIAQIGDTNEEAKADLTQKIADIKELQTKEKEEEK